MDVRSGPNNIPRHMPSANLDLWKRTHDQIDNPGDVIITSKDSYRYQMLLSRQMRVVHLYCPDDDPNFENLYCEIQHVPIATAKYIALSYSWGSEERPFNIPVFDCSGVYCGLISLTLNLRNALRDLMASEVSPKAFWIDQICINQQNTAEKSIQIPEMGEIYRNALQVITYLGPATPADPEGLSLIAEICNYYEPLLRESRGLQPFPSRLDFRAVSLRMALERTPELYLRYDNEATTQETINAFADIVIGPWLQRRWMIQENLANCSQMMLRGRRLVQLNRLLIIVVLMWNDILPQDLMTGLQNSRFASCIETAISLLRFRAAFFPESENDVPSNVHLESLLSSFSTTQCRDARDIIYALLGVASDACDLRIEVDYAKTAEEILIDTAARLICNRDSLEACFSYLPPLDIRPDNLPSWVPNWRHSISEISGVFPSGGEAATQKSGDWHFDEHGRVLVVRGLAVGKLQNPAFLRNFSLKQLYTGLLRGEGVQDYDNFRSMIDMIHENRNILDPEYRLGCTFLTTHKWPHDNDLVEEEQRHLIRAGYMSAMTLLEACATNAKGQSEEPISLNDDMWELGRQYIQASPKPLKTLWIISKLGFALAPNDSKDDDLAVVFLGGQYIYILRPTAEDGMYKFVGHAYIFGLMRGEILQVPDHEKGLEIFRLI